MVFAYVMLLLIPLAIGVTELTIHGFPFFVFRNPGAAAGCGCETTDNQFLHPSATPAANTAKPSTPTPAPTPTKTN
jgi:hypothetical protein